MVNAKTFLEKRYNADLELEDAIHTAILTLKEGFEGQMTEHNIEIGIADENGFRRLEVRPPSPPFPLLPRPLPPPLPPLYFCSSRPLPPVHIVTPPTLPRTAADRSQGLPGVHFIVAREPPAPSDVRPCPPAVKPTATQHPAVTVEGGGVIRHSQPTGLPTLCATHSVWARPRSIHHNCAHA